MSETCCGDMSQTARAPSRAMFFQQNLTIDRVRGQACLLPFATPHMPLLTRRLVRSVSHRSAACTDWRHRVVQPVPLRVHTGRTAMHAIRRISPGAPPGTAFGVLHAAIGALSMLLLSAVASADQIIVHDHFNGTSLAGHSPDTNLPGHVWSVTGSGATLWNQRAWAAGADWAGILATIDTGVADGTIALDWTPGGEAPYGAIVARATDAANYLIAYCWSGTLYLSRITSSGNTLLASTSAIRESRPTDSRWCWPAARFRSGTTAFSACLRPMHSTSRSPDTGFVG
jgi:hypothetical protein